MEGMTPSVGGVSSRLRRTHPKNHTIIPLLFWPLNAREAHSDRQRGDGQAQKTELKSKAAPQRGSGKSNKKAFASIKTAQAKTTTPCLVVPTENPISPLEAISHLLDHLPLHACVELNRRLLTSISSLPTGTARPCAVLRTAIFL